MALPWLMSALYLTSLNGTTSLNDTITSGKENGDIFVIAKVGQNGTVKGVGNFHGGESAVFRFLGIPFAKPPIGELRFNRPEPVAQWSNERDATQAGHECLQPLIPGFSDFFNTSEDCLYLNVYTPTRDRTEQALPVMVWVHGGGYTQMAGSVFDGTSLAEKGVVVVTFNYRLGTLGYMSTEDELIPGNFGLLDQIQALKWVQQHIDEFGGDPNQVTIFGVSAGGTSVSLLTQSPLATGLFHRAIMQSGVSLTSWAYVRPTYHITPRTVAKLIAEEVGCNQSIPDQQFLNCLRQVDAETLIEAGGKVVADHSASFVLLPRVENIYGALPEVPSTLLETGQFHRIDTIRGYAAYESGATMLQAAEDDFRKAVSAHMASFKLSDTGNFTDIFKDIYLSNTTDSEFIARQVTAISSDLDFAGPTVTEVRFAAEKAPKKHHFLYKFDYRPSSSPQPSWVTAVHGDDLPFLFGFSKFVTWPEDHTPTEDDHLVAEQLLTLWTNFAKSGDPTATLTQGGVSWEPFSVDGLQQLVIKKDSALIQFDKPEILQPVYQLLQELDN